MCIRDRCTILTMLHCRLRESLPSEPEPVQSGKHHRSTGRLLLGASVAGATPVSYTHLNIKVLEMAAQTGCPVVTFRCV